MFVEDQIRVVGQRIVESVGSRQRGRRTLDMQEARAERVPRGAHVDSASTLAQLCVTIV